MNRETKERIAALSEYLSEGMKNFIGQKITPEVKEGFKLFAINMLKQHVSKEDLERLIVEQDPNDPTVMVAKIPEEDRAPAQNPRTYVHYSEPNSKHLMEAARMLAARCDRHLRDKKRILDKGGWSPDEQYLKTVHTLETGVKTMLAEILKEYRLSAWDNN